ncbi:MAG: hypothetical protein IPI65_14400 [Bacteroidetes bacterium]|nr:hypothetical protein [Bacteroidota bacterium]
MHQFEDALTAANAAYAISNHNAQLLGALVDANVELGNYAKAVEYCDMMMQLRLIFVHTPAYLIYVRFTAIMRCY